MTSLGDATAVGAANITGTVINGAEEVAVGGRPSVFELVSQQAFSHALRPAFLHVVKTLAERYPSGSIPFFFTHFDEIYLGFDSLVQWHYMLTRRATLSEAFYGLERTSAATLEDKVLRRNRIRLSYLLTVIVPYLRQKLDKFYSKKNDDLEEVRATQENDNAQRLFLKYYPYLKASLELINFIQLLRYSFGYSSSHNLLFLLLNLRFKYVSPSRRNFVEEKKSEIFTPSLWSLRKTPILVLRSLGESVLFGVEIGSFFVKFLDWWYNDPRRERVVLMSLPVPPPLSSSDQNYVQFDETEKNKGICPLCRRKFKNATALSTSGIVFCYGCTTPYIKQHGKCPLTSLRSTMNHLIRIFN